MVSRTSEQDGFVLVDHESDMVMVSLEGSVVMISRADSERNRTVESGWSMIESDELYENTELQDFSKSSEESERPREDTELLVINNRCIKKEKKKRDVVSL
jgi:hypothetical protein